MPLTPPETLSPAKRQLANDSQDSLIASSSPRAKKQKSEASSAENNTVVSKRFSEASTIADSKNFSSQSLPALPKTSLAADSEAERAISSADSTSSDSSDILMPPPIHTANPYRNLEISSGSSSIADDEEMHLPDDYDYALENEGDFGEEGHGPSRSRAGSETSDATNMSVGGLQKSMEDISEIDMEAAMQHYLQMKDRAAVKPRGISTGRSDRFKTCEPYPVAGTVALNEFLQMNAATATELDEQRSAEQKEKSGGFGKKVFGYLFGT